MKKAIIKVHSSIDLITNSSTELFITDDKRDIKIVEELIKEVEKEFPNEYGHMLSVNYAEDYELKEAYDVYNNEEDLVNYLRSIGYEVTKKENDVKYISISAERGGIHPKMEDFIRSNFNIVHYTSEA